MNRADELVHKCLAGDLSSRESEELAALIERGGPESEAALELLQVEGLLRGEFADYDVADTVVRRIQDRVEHDTADKVLKRIRSRPTGGAGHGRQPLRLPRPVFQWALAAAAALAVCVGIARLIRESAVRPPVREEPAVPQIARTEPPPPPREIATGAATNTRIQFAGGSRIDVGSHTRLVIHEQDDSIRVVLKQGRVRAEVVKQPAGHSFAVATPELVAEVVGTRFTVQHINGESTVNVEEGEVEVLSLRSGDRVTMGPGRNLTARGTMVQIK